MRNPLACAGLSQRKMAERTGIAYPQINRYATGKTMASAVALDRIERVARSA